MSAARASKCLSSTSTSTHTSARTRCVAPRLTPMVGPSASAALRGISMRDDSRRVATKASTDDSAAPLKGVVNQAVKVLDKLTPQAGGADGAQRMNTLKEFYTRLDKATAERLLDDNFSMQEMGSDKTYKKSDYIHLLHDITLPAVPDFKWGFATTNEVDNDGYVLVTVAANGNHTGKPLAMPGREEVPASGRRFCLEEEKQLVKVVNGRISEIKVLPTRGAGPEAMYKALKGEDFKSGGIGVLQEELPIPGKGNANI